MGREGGSWDGKSRKRASGPSCLGLQEPGQRLRLEAFQKVCVWRSRRLEQSLLAKPPGWLGRATSPALLHELRGQSGEPPASLGTRRSPCPVFQGKKINPWKAFPPAQAHTDPSVCGGQQLPSGDEPLHTRSSTWRALSPCQLEVTHCCRHRRARRRPKGLRVRLPLPFPTALLLFLRSLPWLLLSAWPSAVLLSGGGPWPSAKVHPWRGGCGESFEKFNLSRAAGAANATTLPDLGVNSAEEEQKRQRLAQCWPGITPGEEAARSGKAMGGLLPRGGAASRPPGSSTQCSCRGFKRESKQQGNGIARGRAGALLLVLSPTYPVITHECLGVRVQLVTSTQSCTSSLCQSAPRQGSALRCLSLLYSQSCIHPCSVTFFSIRIYLLLPGGNPRRPAPAVPPTPPGRELLPLGDEEI